MANPFDEFDAPQGNPFDEFDGALDQQQLDALSRAKALVEARHGGAPLAPPHNAPRYTGIPAGDALSEFRTGTGGFLEGIPIAGPVIRGAVDRAAAATMAPFSDKSYSEVLDLIQRGTEEEKAANPYLDTGAQVAGAVAGTVPMIAAAPGAFGAGAGNFAVRSGLSAATGGGIGGADAAVRSRGDIEAIKLGSGMGGVAGLAGPAAGRFVGSGISKVADALLRRQAVPGISRSTANLLGRAADADQLSVDAMRQRMAELGSEAMAADLGPNLQQHAAALAALPGEARGIVQNAVRAREAGANQRIVEALNSNLGPAPIPSRLAAGIRESQDALGPAYDDVLAGGRAVDTRGLAESLESQLANLRGDAAVAARRVRDMLNVPGTAELDPNPAALHEVRKAIDGMLGTTADSNVLRVLENARRSVDDELGRAVPGIKDVDARFAELARQDEALTRGQTLLRSGPTAVRPQELADELVTGAEPQGLALGPSAVPLRLREGARADLDRIVGTNTNDRAALQRMIAGDGDWNPEKLRSLFGADRTDRMLNVLEAERIFAVTSNFVTRNSATAARQAATNAMEGLADRGLGLGDVAALGGASGVVIKGAAKGVDKIAAALLRAQNEAARAEAARLLTEPSSMRLVEALGERTAAAAREGKNRRLAQALFFAAPLSLSAPGR